MLERNLRILRMRNAISRLRKFPDCADQCALTHTTCTWYAHDMHMMCTHTHFMHRLLAGGMTVFFACWCLSQMLVTTLRGMALWVREGGRKGGREGWREGGVLPWAGNCFESIFHYMNTLCRLTIAYLATLYMYMCCLRTEMIFLYPNSWEVLFDQMMGDVTWSWSMEFMKMLLELSMWVSVCSLPATVFVTFLANHLVTFDLYRTIHPSTSWTCFWLRRTSFPSLLLTQEEWMSIGYAHTYWFNSCTSNWICIVFTTV